MLEVVELAAGLTDNDLASVDHPVVSRRLREIRALARLAHPETA